MTDQAESLRKMCGPQYKIEMDGNHVYRVNGREIVSVTQALVESGIVDTRWFDPWTRERGRMVHKYLELYDLGRLDESSVDPIVEPYFRAYKQFRKDSGFVPDPRFIERKMFNPVYGYVGMVDRAGTIPGKGNGIVDFKSGMVLPHVGLQLIGYSMMPDLKDFRDFRIALQLTEEGKYSVKSFTDPADQAGFIGAVAVAQWKRRHKIKSPNQQEAQA